MANAPGTPGTVTWNTPPPAAIPTFNIVNPGLQMAEALSEAPVHAAEDQAKIATAKATAEMAPLETQTRALAADDAMLQRLAPILSGPMASQALQNPALKNVLAPILERRGMAWTDDPAQIAGIVSPQKPFAQWTQDDVNKAVQAPPAQRVLPRDAPDWLKTAPARVPMTAASVENIVKGLDAKEKLLSDAKSGYTPGQYLQDIKATQARLRAAGMDGDADALNQYLSADGNSLSDAFKERHVGEQFQAEQAKLKALGIHWANEDQYKQDREKDLRAQFDKTLTFKYANLASLDKSRYVAAQNAGRRLDLESQRVQGYLQSIDNAEKRFQSTQQSRDFAIYKGVVQQASSELDNAQKSLNGVTQQINNMAQNAKLRTSPLYQSLVDQAASLKQFIDTQGPILRARQADAQNAMYRTYSGVSGNPTTGPGAAPLGGAQQYPTLHGRPIRQNAAGTGWEYFDGSPVGTAQK